MKIICFIDSLASGGAQRQITELAIGFKENNHDVEIVIYYNDLFYADILIRNGVKIIPLIEQNYFNRVFRICKYIRFSKPDIVLSFLQTPSFIATIASLPFKSWKLIVGERNADPIILKSYKEKFYRLFHIFADYVVGNSQANIDLVKKVNPFISSSKLNVIYNITNFGSDKHIDSSILRSCSRLDKVVIVVAGRYHDQKNYLGLIEALNILPEKYKSKILIRCFGSKIVNREYYELCISKVSEYSLNHLIELNDATSNIREEYLTADFVGLFSHYEGFPNTICEAMSMKKPVIVSAVSDVPLLIKNGINGFLCEPSNIISITNAIMDAIDSSVITRKAMGDNNKIKADETFNKTRIVNEYIEIFNKK